MRKVIDKKYEINQLKEENAELSDKINYYFLKFDEADDGAELSCPYIDGVIERFPESAHTMEGIRTINSQLRYGLMCEKKEGDHLRRENASLKADFKNLHRIICEASDYPHDEIEWTRDQASLAEHVRTTTLVWDESNKLDSNEN